ncbi:M20/M25/M40 family metallo-hydrolase [Intrasporangium sp. YIM S08009]|uniref:M20/M25/M40 family metallo-hydrolase n=1 Tax=Intrasporangium zincisolvens TaxID=3080018 RepID=UPI002B054E61|nr:M20/M25/M40 family metallo-hydrolase [Intrasporangium sp. YIM S08009]
MSPAPAAALRPADAVDRDRLLATFLELVAIDSPTGHEQQIGEVLAARFRELGCTTTQDDVGNLVAVYPGTRPGTVLVSTHMDTAGTDRGIVPVIGDDGVVRTDGTTILGADDKSGLAGCLELVRLLRDHPDWSHPTIEFVSTVGEERGLVGSRHLDVSRLQATHGFVLDTAGVMGSVTYWSPTSVYLTITVQGRKAHAGVEPEKGVSAVQAAADAIAAMPLGRIDEETVANIGTVHGGEARNIIPDTVVLEGMARSHDQGKLDRQLAAMRLACERAAEARGATVDVVAEEIYRTYRIAEDAQPYREAARAIRSLGLEVSPRKSGGGTDGNYFNAKGIPCVALPTGMVDEHATSEHIAIDDLVLACQVLVAVVTQPVDGEGPP